jgi:putative ABC transport system permease protein
MGNVLKTTFRNFTRKPVTNLINLFGLAVSLALVVMLSVFSYSELTTDHFHVNGDRVYLYGQINKGINTPGILKELIDLNIPGVESTVRIAGTWPWQPTDFQVENNEPISSDLIFADEEFFELFTYNAVAGNLKTALKNPMSVVITKSLSEKLFGREQPVGKIMKLNNSYDLTITAVIEEPHTNSCLTFSAVCSNNTRKIVQPNGGEFTDWRFINFQTFLLLENGTSPDETAKRILALFPKDDQKFNTDKSLTPLKELYFSKFAVIGNYLRQGDRRKVMILLMVASLVLIIALVNFINISSTQWLEKIKQFGIMKIFGAKQSTIFRNILSEAFLIFFTALIISIILIDNTYVQVYTGIHISPQLVYSPGFIINSIACTFVLSALFSLIPAWKISNSKAVDNLKKSIESSSVRSSFRGILVTAQFTIAIVLIAFTILVQKQVRFGSSKPGLNQDNIIGIKLTDELREKKDVLKKLLLEKPIVKAVSLTQFYPGQLISNWGTKFNLNGEEKDINTDLFNADAAFFGMIGLELIKGRFYNNDLPTDKGKVVVNETFLRNNTITDPIGGKIVVSMDGRSSEIVGVVKDFHFKSVSQPITPLAIINESGAFYCLVKVHTSGFNSLHTAVRDIKAAVSELSPAFSVDVSFFDQAVANMYKSELQFRRTFTLYAGCAIVICCLGILAMSLFACQHRIKEIGIRKVNGAEAIEILAMLNKDFVKWVAIAFVIATPIAWYAMHQWLQNFAYKTSLSWWVFALAGIIAFGIALITVSLQSWRTATKNPVEALRYE